MLHTLPMPHYSFPPTPRASASCLTIPRAPQPHITGAPHHHLMHPQPIQLNKWLDEMESGAMTRVPNTDQNRAPKSRTKSGRYQPYNTGPAPDSSGRSNEETTRSTRPVSTNRKSKVRNGSASIGDQDFTPGTGARGLSACTICLGRNPHNVAQCNADILWDGYRPSFARKGDQGARLRTASSGDALCLDWNLPRSCNSSSHVARHRCSGCGSSDHGAQTCRLAQPKVQN
jgi:hypothetical protein